MRRSVYVIASRSCLTDSSSRAAPRRNSSHPSIARVSCGSLHRQGQTSASSTGWPASRRSPPCSGATSLTPATRLRKPRSALAGGVNRTTLERCWDAMSSVVVPRATTSPSSKTARRSHRRCASSMKWVTRMTVVPRSRTAATRSQATRRAAGSRPVVISSKTTRRGSEIRARATNSRWRCPPDRSPKAVFRRPVSPHSSNRRSHGGPRTDRREQPERRPDLESLGKSGVLQLAAHDPPHLRGLCARIEAEHTERALVRAPQALKALHRGGLARPVRAEQAEDLTLGHFERDVLHRHGRAVAFSEPAHGDGRLHVFTVPPASPIEKGLPASWIPAGRHDEAPSTPRRPTPRQISLPNFDRVRLVTCTQLAAFSRRSVTFASPVAACMVRWPRTL